MLLIKIDDDKIDEDHAEKERPSEAEILADGLLAVIAGSDTTLTVLSGIFFYLLSNPPCYRLVQEEIDEAFPRGEGDPCDATKLADMPYLNAVM